MLHPPPWTKFRNWDFPPLSRGCQCQTIRVLVPPPKYISNSALSRTGTASPAEKSSSTRRRPRVGLACTVKHGTHSDQHHLASVERFYFPRERCFFRRLARVQPFASQVDHLLGTAPRALVVPSDKPSRDTYCSSMPPTEVGRELDDDMLKPPFANLFPYIRREQDATYAPTHESLLLGGDDALGC